MPGKIIISQRELKILQNASLVAFPVKIQARLYGDTGNGYFHANKIEFGLPMDQDALEASQTFDEYARTCQENGYLDFLASEIAHNNERFTDYRECQRRRHTDECAMDLPDFSDCVECGVYADPGILGLYDITSADQNGHPFAGWHAHPTSVYGPLDRLSRPCDGDSRAVRRLLFSQTRIVGEVITAVSENGGVLTKAFENPRGLKINDSLGRTEVPIEVV